jgi:hypothetical protein
MHLANGKSKPVAPELVAATATLADCCLGISEVLAEADAEGIKQHTGPIVGVYAADLLRVAQGLSASYALQQHEENS